MATAPPNVASIRHVGIAVPEQAMAQADVGEFMHRFHGLDAEGARRLRTLYRRSRIATRHTCLGDFRRPSPPFNFAWSDPSAARVPSTAERMEIYRREAAPLALRACAQALARPGAPAATDVDHLFVASCTGFLAPGLDVLLARALGLPPDVGRTLVGFQGCQAGLSVLRLADQACRADPAAIALVACVELCTLHFQQEPSDDNLLGNSLFSDGAAAVVVAGADVPTTGRRLEIRKVTTILHPDSLEEMTWTVGDHGFELHLSSLIPRILAADVRPLLFDTLALEPSGPAAARFWAVHPGGAAILEGLARSFELPEGALDASWDVLRRFGNMSSPTIHFVLQRFLDDPLVEGPGVAIAFGPGLTVEAALLHARAG